MSETNASSQDNADTSPEAGAEATAPSHLSINERKCNSAAVGGGKTSTVFGALFGAAAAVPT